MAESKHHVATQRLCLGPLLIVISVYLLHASAISKVISGDLQNGYFVKLLFYRMPDLAAGLLFAGIITQGKSRVFSLFGHIVLTAYCLLLILDSFVMASLHDRISIYDLVRFFHEWNSVGGFTHWQHFMLVTSLVASTALRPVIRQKMIPILCIILSAGLVAAALLPTDPDITIRQYRSTTLAQLGAFDFLHNDDHNFKYTEAGLRKYSRTPSRPILGAKPSGNIVLLIVESLSASLSQRTSGISDFTPAFDRVASNGVLFTNVLANHPATEGGMVAILQGVPPLHFPTGTPQVYSEFLYMPSVVQEFNALGYRTVFVTSGDLSFLDRRNYFSSLGFHEVYGVNDIPSFAKAPRFAFDAVPDDYLYREALDRIDHLQKEDKPFFFSLLTVSTHLFPGYIHPYEGAAKEEVVWKWASDEIEKFFLGLQQMGFFESSGTLIVVGDHRKMFPVSVREKEVYGESAVARVPLLMVGKHFTPGRRDNRFLQLSDIFPLFDKLESEDPLSKFALFVNRYTAYFDFVTNASKVEVFHANGQWCSAELSGDSVKLSNDAMADRDDVLDFIHHQRSEHQIQKMNFLRSQ